jgi:uncharacterized caspase-like protein
MILVSLLVAAPLAATDAYAERRVALVIGNSDYAQAVELRNPRNDAIDIAASLKSLGFEVQLGLDLDKPQFAATIDQFAQQLDQADVGLFYYAGHGLQLGGKNYLVPTNAKLDNASLISGETIDVGAIVRLMESKAPVNLIFLDACRNNPMAEKLKDTLVSAHRNTSVGRGLARIEPTGHDTLVAFAAAPGHEVADGSGRNSPFAAALLRHLPQPDLEVSVMLKLVAADVRRDTGDEQRPRQVSDMSRTFYFAKAETKPEPAAVVDAGSSKPTPTAPPGHRDSDDRELDIAYWNSARSQGDCDAVRAYLRRFPQGNFVDLAKLLERRSCATAKPLQVPEAAPAAQGPDASPVVAAVQPPQSVAKLATAVPATPDVAAEASAAVVVKPAPSSALLAAKEAVQESAKQADPDLSSTPPGVRHDAEAPPGAPEAATAGPDLPHDIQLELVRVGCGDIRADGEWRSATRAAVRRFNEEARTAFDVQHPSPALLAALHEHGQRVCPLACAPGFQAHGDTCEAIQTASTGSRRRHAAERLTNNQRPLFLWPGFDNRTRKAWSNRPCGFGASC